jgi:hypothetical protein
MKLADSRRLTGPNLLLAGPGAVIDIELEGEDPERLVEAWQLQARRILAEVGWPDSELAHRAHPGGLTLAFAAPIDALYAATEVNEWAFDAARAGLEGTEPGDLAATGVRLRAEIDTERNAPLIEVMAVPLPGPRVKSRRRTRSTGRTCTTSRWPWSRVPTAKARPFGC